jgi:hypothetical protein
MMDEPFSAIVEIPLPDPPFHFSLERQEKLAQSACIVALGLQTILAISIVGFMYFALITNSRDGTMSGDIFGLLISLLISAECGGFVFLSHGWFLLPRNSSTRFVAPLGVFSITAAQLSIALPIAGEVASNVLSYALAVLVFYFVSLWMTGWFFHRLFGASLSFGGQVVYQEAIGTKVLLLLAPFFVLLGLIPIIGSMILGNTTNSAAAIVSVSLTMLGITVFPLAIVYLLVGLVKLKGNFVRFITGGAVTASIVAMAITVDSQVNQWILSPWTGMLAAFIAGVGLALTPFVWNRFWPVWAKRKQVVETKYSVSFDDVV